MNRRRGLVGLLVIVAAAAFAADQVSKTAIDRLLPRQGLASPEHFGVVPGIFWFENVLNQGGMWSLLANQGPWGNRVLIIAACVAMVVISGLVWQLIRASDRLGVLTMGLIIGGALGNLLDRIQFGGVRDFLAVDLQFYRWPTFNLADSWLVIGAGLMILASFRSAPAAETLPATTDLPSSTPCPVQGK